MLEQSKTILFDGVCNLCNGAVTFVINRDKKEIFQFATLQSEAGRALLSKFKIDRNELDSIILVDGDRFYSKSSAALYIAKHLSGAYPLFFGLIILPKFFRDWVYDIIAKNRYRWFGKREQCMLPTPELSKRFL